MPEGMEIEVETIDLENQSADEPLRNRRFLFNVRTFCRIKIILTLSNSEVIYCNLDFIDKHDFNCNFLFKTFYRNALPKMSVSRISAVRLASGVLRNS